MSLSESAEPLPVPAANSPTLRGHVQIMRVDHWTKNVFVLPGVVAAVSLTGAHFGMATFIPGEPRTFGVQLTARF